MLNPLAEWICDSCGDIIDDPNRGNVISRTHREDHTDYDFRVVHKNMEGRQCDPGAGDDFVHNLAIAEYLGPVGQTRLLSELSIGPLMGGGHSNVRLEDMDAFVDLFRRMQTPYYEEARQHWNEEYVQEWLSDSNEVAPYTPATLEKIVKRSF